MHIHRRPYNFIYLNKQTCIELPRTLSCLRNLYIYIQFLIRGFLLPQFESHETNVCLHENYIACNKFYYFCNRPCVCVCVVSITISMSCSVSISILKIN